MLSVVGQSEIRKEKLRIGVAVLNGAVLISDVEPRFSPARAALKGGSTFKLAAWKPSAIR